MSNPYYPTTPTEKEAARPSARPANGHPQVGSCLTCAHDQGQRCGHPDYYLRYTTHPRPCPLWLSASYVHQMEANR